MEIVLEVAVSMLTESYRGPFKKLLNDATEYLTKDIIKMLDDTLKPYPHFKVGICLYLYSSNKLSHIGLTKITSEEKLKNLIVKILSLES